MRGQVRSARAEATLCESLWIIKGGFQTGDSSPHILPCDLRYLCRLTHFRLSYYPPYGLAYCIMAAMYTGLISQIVLLICHTIVFEQQRRQKI